MFPRVVFAALLLVTLPLAPGAAGEPIDPTRPAAAVGIPGRDNAFIVWAPGAEPADYYKVYGVSQGGPSYIGHAAGEYFLEVPAAFPSYAVTAVVAGVESEPTAVVMLSGPCVNVHHGVPPTIGVGCLDKVPEVGAHADLRP